MRRLVWILCLGFLGSAALAKTDPSGDWALPNFAQRLAVTVRNPGRAQVRSLVTLSVVPTAKIAPGFPGTLAIVMEVNPPDAEFPADVLPSQVDDLDGDGLPDQLEFPISLGPGESREVQIYYSTTLSGSITYPKEVHASHAYGYNHQTATLESTLIGYRTYGGFLLDVQARREGHPGLYNDLDGFLAVHKNFLVGRDVFHVGDTLGLGGLFLAREGHSYRPSFNVPDYAHRPSPEEVPHYRVVADGPLRAIVEAKMERWTIGEDQVELREVYSIDTGEGFVRCAFEIVPLRLAPGHSYDVGAGIRDLPQEKLGGGRGLLDLAGQQTVREGPLGLALYFDPAQVASAVGLQTPEGSNRVVIFNQHLEPGRAVSGSFAAAAAWSRSGIQDPVQYLADEQQQVEARVEVGGERLDKNPQPERINGEAY
jgi:hypothetical protein